MEADRDIRRFAQQIAERDGFVDFIEASAKTNHNVESIFDKAVSLVSKTQLDHVYLNVLTSLWSLELAFSLLW